MYRHILAAVNEHTNSELAARYALALARACKAKITLTYVSPEPVDKDALRVAETALGRLFAEAQESGLEAESVILGGDPVERIAAHALEHGVDIVFSASRHETARRPFFVRTVSRGLILKLNCAAAVVRVAGMGRAAPKSILLPLRGGKAFVEERAYFAGMLARGFGAKVTLFHLPEPVRKFFSGEVRLGPAEREKRVPGDVLELAGYLERLGVECDLKTARGMTSASITTEAVQIRSGLIVMGASQRSLVTALVKGNPVEELMKAPPCNLVIFRPGRRP
jgi:nucleotide-binding universal stress UspA family protein